MRPEVTSCRSSSPTLIAAFICGSNSFSIRSIAAASLMRSGSGLAASHFSFLSSQSRLPIHPVLHSLTKNEPPSFRLVFSITGPRNPDILLNPRVWSQTFQLLVSKRFHRKALYLKAASEVASSKQPQMQALSCSILNLVHNALAVWPRGFATYDRVIIAREEKQLRKDYWQAHTGVPLSASRRRRRSRLQAA